MSLTWPIIEADENFSILPEEFEQNPQAGEVIITRNGKPILAVLSWERYESIMETLEIMGDDKTMSALRQGIQEAEAGHTYGLNDIKQQIGV